MTITPGMSNLAYHANTTHLSSSAVKLLVKDPAQYHKEYILGLRDQTDKPAFQDGTLLHTLVLEEHLLLTDYAIFPGMRRAGSLWEQFKSEHADKKIITAAQLSKVEKWYQGYKRAPAAIKLISGGFSEHTMTGDILGVPVKARADYINIDMSYIVDVKTTSEPTDSAMFRHSVSHWMYELSAAFYCEIARQSYGKLFDFYWVVCSKTDSGCAVYKASSATLSEGTRLYTTGLVKYISCLQSGIWSDNIKPTINLDVEEI